MNLLTKSRKARCDSVLDALLPEQKRALERWLDEENRGYEEVRQRVAAEFGVATSRSALSRYFRKRGDQRAAAPWMNGGGHELRLTEEEFAAWREVTPEMVQGLENAALARARELAFRAITERDPDLERVSRLMAIARDVGKAQIERARAELAERKMALKEARLAVRGTRNDEGVARNAEIENVGGGREIEAGDEARATTRADREHERDHEQEHERGREHARGRGESSSKSRIILDRAA